MNSNQPPSSRLLLLALLVLTLAGCARVDFEESLARTNRTTAEFTGGNLALAQTDEQRAAMTKTTATLLARPLSPPGLWISMNSSRLVLSAGLKWISLITAVFGTSGVVAKERLPEAHTVPAAFTALLRK